MELSKIEEKIDHAVLRPEATDEDLVRECKIASKYNIASVCVKPCHVSMAKKLLDNSSVKVSTVIGFPSGGTTTANKVSEAEEAILNGAEELDMVINNGKLLSGELDYVKNDIKMVVGKAHKSDVILKVIIETSLLNDDQKALACKLSEDAGADFVKTSTGFNGGGADIKDIMIMKSSVSPKMKIKASGGIKTLEQAKLFVEAGCHRLGTSSTEQILSLDCTIVSNSGY